LLASERGLSNWPKYGYKLGNNFNFEVKLNLSDQEKALLREIQRDASLSVTDLAERVGMAQSTAWRRLQEFENQGVIRGRVALLDPAKVDAGFCVFANITLGDHSEEAVAAFASLVKNHSEIQECHKLTGSADYVLKIRTRDVEEYENFMTHNLLRNPFVSAVSSSVSLKQLKSTTELPL